MHVDMSMWKLVFDFGVLLFIASNAIIWFSHLFSGITDKRVGLTLWLGVFLAYLSILRQNHVFLWACFLIAGAMIPVSQLLFAVAMLLVYRAKGGRIAESCEPGSIIDRLFVKDRYM